jgi:hypothetical protein
MRPVHKIQPNKRSVVAFTWCGVDPARKGVESSWPTHPKTVTCKDCLRAEAEHERTKHVRHPVKVTKLPSLARTRLSPLSTAVEDLIDKYGVAEVLDDIQYAVYGRIDGTENREDIYEILAEANQKIRALRKEGP